MDRRNFLAFLPSISAIPFIGKEIIQNESGIHIIKPTPIIESGIYDGFDPHKVEIRLYQEGKHIANAYMTEFNIDRQLINDDLQYIPGVQSMTFSGVVTGPIKGFNKITK